ncbi:hypothetical protein BMJ34_36225 [Sinorhizobium medicae]|uniref:Uncharacterized protein n=2 Tax=Sinorhizobium medicae TaxID=110321 RepID=A0ABX4TC91_9HYPH|nr:hypothetical protein BMJ34_36225 [Sinorhizobium medicae]PLT92936.1 hypothetical protein BMJ33_32220 [Sinorhizobium medicae]PLU12103.1 hypothetical protein BMJ29_33555 [Sinorhizobium medicae]PLU14028.1 hypothetical protein BMJ30_24440 [Sinorhizobium medicae]PLU30397.1 hypothetical protein BMJ27_24310 [Sinorhizobium medicae]
MALQEEFEMTLRGSFKTLFATGISVSIVGFAQAVADRREMSYSPVRGSAPQDNFGDTHPNVAYSMNARWVGPRFAE